MAKPMENEASGLLDILGEGPLADVRLTKAQNDEIAELIRGELARVAALQWRQCVIETFGLDDLLTDDPESISIDRSEDGHSGPGWYAWSDEYPEEGSIFLGPEAPPESAESKEVDRDR